jgi:hypothetical protein
MTNEVGNDLGRLEDDLGQLHDNLKTTWGNLGPEGELGEG